MKKNIINNDIQWFDINLMEKIKTFAIEIDENEWENCKDLTCCIIGPNIFLTINRRMLDTASFEHMALNKYWSLFTLCTFISILTTVNRGKMKSILV